MHDIEPFHNWRGHYVASEDQQSPFFGRIYDEFRYTNKVYNYFIHPQWDDFGSTTLYMKILFVDYEDRFAIIELIGEWNDCIDNDVMYLKRKVVDFLIDEGISRFILICENVLNFHGSDNSYYEEWYDDVVESSGWICLINTLDHVIEEMGDTHLQQYVHFGPHFNNLNWRPQKPKVVYEVIQKLLQTRQIYLN